MRGRSKRVAPQIGTSIPTPWEAEALSTLVRELMKHPAAQKAMLKKAEEMLGITDADVHYAPNGRRYIDIEAIARGLGTTTEELLQIRAELGDAFERERPDWESDPKLCSMHEINGRMEHCINAHGLLRKFFEFEPQEIAGSPYQNLIEQFQRLGRDAIAADAMIRANPRDVQDVLDELFDVEAVKRDMTPPAVAPVRLLQRAIERASALRAVR